MGSACSTNAAFGSTPGIGVSAIRAAFLLWWAAIPLVLGPPAGRLLLRFSSIRHVQQTMDAPDEAVSRHISLVLDLPAEILLWTRLARP